MTPEKIGRSAGEKAVARLNPRKVSTRKVPVVFDSHIAGSIVGHLVGAINGAAVARKTSFLKDKLGERIFAPGINIIDDPLRRRGLRSRPFDAEGVAGKRMALIEDGVLKTWLLDSATARELGLATTGHAQRSASSTPSPGATNLHLEPGDRSPEDLIKDIDEGFYVTDLIGMGANMVTGDYSRGAAGFWIEKGQRTYPVSEVTIAGHLLDIFRTRDAGQRSAIPLWHQRADLAPRGVDHCRRLSFLRDRERLAAAVQEAGAIAKKFFRRAAEAMDQGAGRFAGHRSRHRRQRSPAQASGRSRRRLAVGGKRERSDAACRAPRLGGRSDRRHARLHRRPRGLVGVGGAGGGRPAGGCRAVRAGHR